MCSLTLSHILLTVGSAVTVASRDTSPGVVLIAMSQCLRPQPLK